MPAAWLADAVLIVHVLFVLFVVGGFALILAGARRWSWVHNRVYGLPPFGKTFSRKDCEQGLIACVYSAFEVGARRSWP